MNTADDTANSAIACFSSQVVLHFLLLFCVIGAVLPNNLRAEFRSQSVYFEIRYPGVYRVTAEELSNSGVIVEHVISQNLNLISNGTTVPLAVVCANGNNFRQGDYIEFVGGSPRGNNVFFMPDNPANVYVLSWESSNTTVKQTHMQPAATKSHEQSYWKWHHYEKDYIFSFSTLPPDITDNFFWFSHRADTPHEKTHSIYLGFPGFDNQLKYPAELFLSVFGSTNATGLQPSHQFDVFYDQKPVGQFQFDGIALHQASVQIPSTLVKPNPVKLGLAAPDNRTTAVDNIYINSIDVRYPSRFDADMQDMYVFNNDLVSGSESTDTLHITNLPAGASIFDPGTSTVWQLAPDQTSAAIPNNPQLTTYTAVAPYARMKVDHIELVTSTTAPSDLPDDLQTLVVYHPRLQKTADAYIQYRKERGWNIAGVSVRDIFDQRNHGFINDEALKNYLADVKSHAPGLTHLVLIGDAYFDYREARSFDNEKQLDILIPIHWVYRPGVTWSGGYQDDNWYGSFANEFRPDIAVGRIAVNSDEEGMEYLRKIIEYETLRKSADDKGLLISSVEKSFQQYVTEIGTAYQDKVSSVSYLFPEAEKATQEVTDLLNAINEGAQFIYYVGHGGSMVWRVGPVDFARQKDLFTPKDVSKLQNQGHYPIVVCASCYTTSFDQPESIGEAMVNQPGGGAIAVIGAPWKATVQESHDFNRLFFKHYFDPSVKTIGEASLKAHRDHVPETQSHALFNSFTMLGDPCLEIVR